MMVITVKIILGVSPVGPVVGEDEIKAENHGIIIIQMIEAKTLKGKTCKEEGVVIKVEAGDVVTTHSRGNNKHIIKITSHLKAYTLIWLHRPGPRKI